MVRATVSGRPDDGLAYRRVNGWTFWRYTDAKGQSRRMDVLRQRYETNQRGRRPAKGPMVLSNDPDRSAFATCGSLP